MTEKELAAELKGNFTKGFAGRYGKLIAENDLFGFALNLGLDRDPAVAFHASYALERAFFIAPEAFGRHIGHFVRNYLAIVNPSACRHYSKMMAWLLDRRRIELTDSQRQQVAEATFDRLIDPSVRPAVKVWSMEILDSLSAELPWVEEQLYDTICWLMRDDGPALRNRGTNLPPHPCATEDYATVIVVYSRFLYL